MQYVHKTMSSPVGKLTLVATESGLAAILWEDDDPRRVRIEHGPEDRRHPILVETENQLGEYFASARKQFSVELTFVCGTPFQRRVWQALRDIPFGETRTYSDLARGIGCPKAARAVGAANGKNPLSIVAPCHRVIGMSGNLTGFAGGLAAKAHLLRLEGVESVDHHTALRERRL
jgi:methylated-DNA-[protein]-cysteine S-methyltransferase